jgi:hypothetical protein
MTALNNNFVIGSCYAKHMNKFQQVFPRGMEGTKKTMYELSRFLELNWAKEIYSFFYKLCPTQKFITSSLISPPQSISRFEVVLH